MLSGLARRESDALAFTAEMHAVQLDQLAVVLGLTPEQASGVVSRWRNLGLAESARLGPGPAWVWASQSGLAACGLPYPAGPPAPPGWHAPGGHRRAADAAGHDRVPAGPGDLARRAGHPRQPPGRRPRERARRRTAVAARGGGVLGRPVLGGPGRGRPGHGRRHGARSCGNCWPRPATARLRPPAGARHPAARRGTRGSSTCALPPPCRSCVRARDAQGRAGARIEIRDLPARCRAGPGARGGLGALPAWLPGRPTEAPAPGRGPRQPPGVSSVRR